MTTQMITFQIPAELKTKLDECSQATGMTLGAVYNVLLKQGLKSLTHAQIVIADQPEGPPGITKVQHALLELMKEPEPDSCGHRCNHLSDRVGIRMSDGYKAMLGLEERGLVTRGPTDFFRIDRYGRPVNSFWSLAVPGGES